MQRKVIEIDEALCDGCEQCIDACAEGALALVDGKAKVVKDQFCDGLGACIGDCPTGALKIVEREAEAYDPVATEAHVRKLRGEAGVKRMHESAEEHAAEPAAAAPASHAGHHHGSNGGGCPGSRMRMPEPSAGQDKPAAISGDGLPAKVNPSDLGQWPVQLHLVPPQAPFFQDKELLVLNSCGAVASADVHWRYLRGRSVVMACPKLDVTDPYVQKLTAIMAENRIPKVVVVRMQVPCCGGLTQMVLQAHAECGRDDLVVEEVTLSLDGAVMRTEVIAGPAAARAGAGAPQRAPGMPLPMSRG